ncbi:uncharacterized protein A4U43_C05F25600 [Asparagus officinalis]|uniref:Uncharacterized protein n=1 Tax=Asparagus officinalis TaxID=4686 RepID=A0A5P1EZU2_ASPOF|nr:uncharacterized protein A4U43_C05F25600 [Asparagus officinalis]
MNLDLGQNGESSADLNTNSGLPSDSASPNSSSSSMPGVESTQGGSSKGSVWNSAPNLGHGRPVRMNLGSDAAGGSAGSSGGSDISSDIGSGFGSSSSSTLDAESDGSASRSSNEGLGSAASNLGVGDLGVCLPKAMALLNVKDLLNITGPFVLGNG